MIDWLIDWLAVRDGWEEACILHELSRRFAEIAAIWLSRGAFTCRVIGNTVWSRMASDAPYLGGLLTKSYLTV